MSDNANPEVGARADTAVRSSPRAPSSLAGGASVAAAGLFRGRGRPKSEVADRRERSVYNIIAAAAAKSAQTPVLQDIADDLGIDDRRVVQRHIDHLVSSGYLKRLSDGNGRLTYRIEATRDATVPRKQRLAPPPATVIEAAPIEPSLSPSEQRELDVAAAYAGLKYSDSDRAKKPEPSMRDARPPTVVFSQSSMA